MRKTGYVYKGLLKLAWNRKGTAFLCLLGCTVGVACILIFFSVERRILVNDLQAWSDERAANIYFASTVPADELYALLEEQDGLNGYVFYMNVAQRPEVEERVEFHGVWGSVSARLKEGNAMAGRLEGSSEDQFMLRSADSLPPEYMGRADEMPLEINGVPFSCGGVQNGSRSIPQNQLPPTDQAVTLQRPGSETVLQPNEMFPVDFFPSVVVVTAACAAKHAYPVAALRVCYTEPDSKPLFLRLLGQLGDGVARYEMPWAESEVAPSFDQVPFGMLTRILPIVIALLTMMTLLYFWLGSFRFALRIWQREGAKRGPCRQALFFLGMTLLALAAGLGYGVYRLVLLWGDQNGLMLRLPGSVVSLLIVIYVCVCMLCMGLYSAKAARISLEKGGLRE